MRACPRTPSWKSIYLLAASHVFSTYAQMTVQSGMTADSYCGKSFCVTALYVPQEKQIMYTLVVPSKGPAVGWYAIGQGDGMKGANMAINWANADGTLTTSHRSASGNMYPTEAQASSLSKMTLDPQMSSTTSTRTIWSWFIAQETAPANANKMPHIYAYSPTTPTSSNSSSGIGMHTDTNCDIFLDMTKPYTGKAAAGLDGNFGASAGAQRDLSQAKVRLYLAHMILMTIGWMLIVPIGIFIARFGRGKFTWFPAHRSVQGFAYLVIIIAAILAALGMKKEQNNGKKLGKHAKSGLGVLILFLIQGALGSFTHYYRAKTGRRWFGYIHMPLGIIIVAASVYTINLGFKMWKWKAPNAARYFIFAWAAFLACVYIIGMLLIPRQRKLEQAKAVQKHIDKSSTEMEEVKQVLRS